MASFLRFLQYGYAPDVIEKYLIETPLTPYIKGVIGRNIESIIFPNKKNFKIGKTGDAAVRSDHADYRTADYEKMYILYCSKNKTIISDLESYLIKKFKKAYPKRCDNIHLHSAGIMVSKTAYYYIYLVI